MATQSLPSPHDPPTPSKSESTNAKTADPKTSPISCRHCDFLAGRTGGHDSSIGRYRRDRDPESGEHDIGEFPWAMTHARHLATELARFLDTFNGVVVSHRDPLEFTPQEVLIRDALDHSKATLTLLKSLREQYR